MKKISLFAAATVFFTVGCTVSPEPMALPVDHPAGLQSVTSPYHPPENPFLHHQKPPPGQPAHDQEGHDLEGHGEDDHDQP